LRLRALGLLAMVSACATLANSGGGDDNLPEAGLGPFREIATDELGNNRVAPYALRDDDEFARDVSVIDTDGDSSTLDVWAYAARTVFAEGVEPDPTMPTTDIVRHVAADGRSFERNPDTVLQAEAPWEQGTIGKPSALRVDGEVWLYYAGAGGIGLAKSSDGVSFTRVGTAPVLDAADGWENGLPPTSPAVTSVQGGFVMFYEVALAEGSAIGEARSDDGSSWVRVGGAPVLSPGGGYDAGGAGSPFSLMLQSAEGRDIQVLYYGATDGEGKRTIALAARVDASGAFRRAAAPVFGSANALGPREPCLLRYATYTLLFATQQAGTTSALDFPAVAVGVAPAAVGLPSPVPP